MHIMAQYMLINGDIETSILIYTVIMGDIAMYMYINGDFQKWKFFILLSPENSLKFKGKTVLL